MVAFPKLFPKRAQPAYDYQAAADEFLSHWFTLLERASVHADETNTPDAVNAALLAVNAIRHSIELFNETLGNAIEDRERALKAACGN